MTGYLNISAGEPKTTLTGERTSVATKSTRLAEPALTAATTQPKADQVRRDDLVEPAQIIDDFAKLREQLRTMAEAMPAGSSLMIDRDSDSGRFVYRFIDPDSGEVLRQFPADDVLKRAATLRQLTGALVDDSA